MKKQGLLIRAVLMVFTFVACTSQAGSASSTAPEPSVEIQQEISATEESQLESTASLTPADEATASKSNILIAYFSSAGNILTDEPARGNVGSGITQTIAETIQKQVGGDLFFIEVANKYPSNYNDTISVAMQELRSNARPELATHVENFDGYDVVFIGYPNWWGTLPQAILTFVEEYEFSGKTVIPFCTYQDSGIGRSVDDLEKALPDSTLLQNFSVPQADANDAEEDIKHWLSELNLGA